MFSFLFLKVGMNPILKYLSNPGSEACASGINVKDDPQVAFQENIVLTTIRHSLLYR